MRIAVVDGERGIEVPGELLVELVPPGDRVHVGRVALRRDRTVIVLSARIARRRPGMTVANADVVAGAEQVLGSREPEAIALALVLELLKEKKE